MSDFSAIHRVADIEEMNGPDFFKKAWRMSAYTGVMKMRVMNQIEKEQPAGGSAGSSRASTSADDEVRTMTPEQMFVGHSELFELGAAG